LITPKILPEFLHSSDDAYDNTYIAVLAKILRIICVFITLTASSLYITVVSFNPEVIPTEYIIFIAKSRATVPSNSFLEVVIMEVISEILREFLFRVPNKIGPAIGIASAIIIGQTAVAAGLFSPLMMIII